MSNLRFAVIGCGFWANYQVPAWFELEGIELVALYNRTISKAVAIAKKYNIQSVYDDITALLHNEQLDFVDIISDVDTHAIFTKLAACKGLPVICQKPMAADYESAKQMVAACKQANMPLYIHENFRWQLPVRKVKEALDSNIIGKAFKARISFCSGFPVFDNQPSLKELPHFILTDIGSHILDICRFLFGEAQTLYCQAQRVNNTIKGEDVANVFMKMESGLHCYAEMSYATVPEKEPFPQTLVVIEGDEGTISLTGDYALKVITKKGTTRTDVHPYHYQWANKDYDLVHSSIVDCNRNILGSLQGKNIAETTGDDNLKTVRLVWASYHSAEENKVIVVNDF